MKPQLLLLWPSPRGCSCGGCFLFPEWVIQERTCTQDKVQSLFSDVTHLHFCICLVSQVNPMIDWERTTQGWEYQEIRFTWRLVTIPINPPCQPFFIWSQFCYCEQIIWLVYSSCVLLLLLSHFRCVRLCNLMDSSPPGSPIPGILQARTLGWVAVSFSTAWESKVKLKSLSHVRLFETPWTAAYQAPPSVGFSRQEYWCGFPLSSPACVLSGLIYSILDLLSSRPTHLLIF